MRNLSNKVDKQREALAQQLKEVTDATNALEAQSVQQFQQNELQRLEAKMAKMDYVCTLAGLQSVRGERPSCHSKHRPHEPAEFLMSMQSSMYDYDADSINSEDWFHVAEAAEQTSSASERNHRLQFEHKLARTIQAFEHEREHLEHKLAQQLEKQEHDLKRKLMAEQDQNIAWHFIGSSDEGNEHDIPSEQHCFTLDTLLCTPNHRLMVPVDVLRKGSLVLGSQGSALEVHMVKKMETDTIIRLMADGMAPLEVAPGHRIMLANGDVGIAGSSLAPGDHVACSDKMDRQLISVIASKLEVSITVFQIVFKPD